MKTTFIFFQTVVLLSLSMSFTACNKDRDDDPALTNDEVVALVEAALQTETEGVAAESADAAYIADTYTEKSLTMECGQTIDSTVTRTYNNAQATANYVWNWNWTLNCDQLGLPATIAFGAQSSGSYQTSRMSSNDNMTSNLVIEDLVLGANYTLSGAYTRSGSQTSGVRNQNAFTSTLVIEIDDLKVAKGTRRIVSGTADFVLTGEGTGGRSFSFEGDIIFNNDGTATLVINGMQYTIDLF